MQKKTKSKLVSFLFFVVCLAVCAISLHLFWQDLNATTERMDREPIATISFKHNIAQRKFNDRVVWERLQQQSPLYDEDTIRTSDLSQAKITFLNGSSIEIDECSMIQISQSKSGLINISVGSGNVVVDTTNAVSTSSQDSVSAVSITMENGSVVKLDKGSRVSASTSEEGENLFVLQAGKADYSDRKGSTVQISSGESVKVEKSGTVTKNKITVTSVSRELNLLNVADEEKNVTLKWNTVPELEKTPVKVETSYSKDFAKIEDVFETKGADSLELDSPKGQLYWRVYAENDVKNAVTGKINVASVEKITCLSPIQGANITYRKDRPVLNFSWKGNPYADYYRLDVYSGSNFKDPVLTKKVTQEKITLNSFEEGSYSWRVTPHYEMNSIGFAGESTLNSFTVTRLKTDEKPMLSLPVENSTFVLSDASTPLTFAWKSYAQNPTFTIIISDREDFKNTVWSASSNENRFAENFNINSLPEKKYYWKVRRASIEDEGGYSESDIRSFAVKKYVPGEVKLNYPPQKFAAEKNRYSTTEFTWKLPQEYSSDRYESVVQISKTPDFKEIIKESRTLQSHSSFPDLANGQYYWRVGIEEAATRNMVTLSEGRKFEVLKELVSPEMKKKISQEEQVVLDNGMVKLEWDKVPEADYYTVKLLDKNGNTIRTETAKTNSIQMPVPQLRQGEKASYDVSVQSVCEESETSPIRLSKPKETKLVLRESVPVNLESPVGHKIIPGLSALRGGVVLKWKENDKVVSSTLVLKKILPNGTEKTVETIKNPAKAVSFKRLAEGNYVWTIKATGNDGVDLSSKEKGNFTVAKVPQLQLPVLKLPKNNFVIDSNYLKENRSIKFDWADVPDATDYLFELFIKNTDGTLRRLAQQELKKSEFVYKEISRLDIKDFVWQVTAFNHANDGYVEQKSKVASGLFKIRFELPSAVRTIDPGIQYGQ